MQNYFKIYPLGRVIQTGSKTWVEIDPAFAPALLGIEDFSHLVILYWFDRNDTTEKRRILQVHPRSDPAKPLRGVFATHAPVRPNLIATCLCRLVAVENNRLHVEGLDALPESPVVDIKPYIPPSLTTDKVRLPDWLEPNTKSAPG